MIFRLVFKEKDSGHVYSAGVYAQTEELARQIGVVLIFRAYNYRVEPNDPDLKVVEVTGLNSDVATTT